MRACLLFLVVLLLPLAASAQVYHLISAEGQPVSVSLGYKLFSKRLAVSCANDSLFLADYQGTKSVRVLQHRFLQITYQARCGSDCGVQHTAIITIRHHKLQVALLVVSPVESVSYANSPARHYSVALTMLGKPEDTYTLLAQVKEGKSVPESPMQNHTLNQQVTLHWDETRQVFYSALEPTARCLPVFDDNAKNLFGTTATWTWQLMREYAAGLGFLDTANFFHVVPQWVVGTFPVVRLGNQLCYFMRGNWYVGQGEIDPSSWFMSDYVTR